jgi:ABC-type phosphate transport system substrate-binding protein
MAHPPNRERLPASSTLDRRRVVCAAVGVVLTLGRLARADSQLSVDAGEFIVIVNHRNPASSASSEFLADAFLKKATRWDGGESIHPVDQSVESSVRRAFSAGVLRRSVGAVRAYWQQRIFSGRDVPPPEVDSDEAVVRYVSKYAGGIGYVSASAKLDDTKVIAIQ